jgi:hypothetical protein
LSTRNREVSLTIRTKNPQEHEEDKVRLKQLAILWWAQKIYEGAHKQCLDDKAYRYHHGRTADSVESNRKYMVVLKKMRTLAKQLNGKIDEKDLWPEVERSPSQAQTLSNNAGCTSDADCAEYFVCEGGECEPILPPAKLT